MVTGTFEDALLHLPPEQRVRLTHELLFSLEEQSEDKIAQAWGAEVQRRAADIANGVAASVSAEDVHTAARLLLR